MVEPPSSHGEQDAVQPPPKLLFNRFRVGDLIADPISLTVGMGGDVITLTPTEWRLLSLFVLHAGAVLTRDELTDGMWGGGDHHSALQVALSRLRRKLETLRRGRPELIQTVRNSGYRLDIAPLEGSGPDDCASTGAGARRLPAGRRSAPSGATLGATQANAGGRPRTR